MYMFFFIKYFAREPIYLAYLSFSFYSFRAYVHSIIGKFVFIR